MRGIRINIIFFFSVISALTLFGQNENKINLFSENTTFQGLGISPYLDMITSPAVPARVQNGLMPDQRTPRMVDSYAQTVAISMLTIFYEYRTNLLEPSDNFALAVSVLPALGLSITRPVKSLNGIDGFGHVQLAFLGKLYLGQLATQRSSNDYGVNIGIGYELNKIGILNMGNHGSHEKIPNPIFFMPTVSLSLNTLRNRSPVEFNVKVGRGSVDYVDLDGFGFPIIPKKVTSAYSLRLAAIYFY